MVVFGILCLVGRLWYTKEKKYANIFLPILVYSLGIIVGVGPWIIKNIVETQSLSVIKMLYGDSRYYVPDYSLIHSPEKLESIKELGSVNTISDS